jgi:hypothetical protein
MVAGLTIRSKSSPVMAPESIADSRRVRPVRYYGECDMPNVTIGTKSSALGSQHTLGYSRHHVGTVRAMTSMLIAESGNPQLVERRLTFSTQIVFQVMAGRRTPGVSRLASWR